MPKHKVNQQRKKPVQKRAQKTVEKILNAAAKILQEEGAEALTTNHIAETAKVNIGSVYQNYPNKEAILEDLAARAFALITRVLSEKAISLSKTSMREGLQQGLSYVVSMYRNSENLFGPLFDSQQDIFSGQASNEFRKVLLRVGKQYIENENSGLRGKDAECALYVSYNSIVFVLATHLKGNDVGKFTDQQIIEELTNMVCGYLGLENNR
jgi:AcrR family transcriptional regulator